MTEPGAALAAVQMAIADLAVALVGVRAGLGGECLRAGRLLEMGEMDLLSAWDAVEKARLEIDLAGPTAAAVRVTVPANIAINADTDVESRLPRRRARTRRRGFPGPGQAELFSMHDVTSNACR
jgi:hypothetical protein